MCQGMEAVNLKTLILFFIKPLSHRMIEVFVMIPLNKANFKNDIYKNTENVSIRLFGGILKIFNHI